jgi:hypothetical protein
MKQTHYLIRRFASNRRTSDRAVFVGCQFFFDREFLRKEGNRKRATEGITMEILSQNFLFSYNIKTTRIKRK